MSQSKEVHREYMRKRREGSQESEEGSQYPPILYALADPVKRKKLADICMSLKNHNKLSNVYYGCGKHSLSMDTVNELLDVTGG